MKRLALLFPLVLVGISVVGCPTFPEACDYGGCADGGADGTPTDGANPDGSAPDGKVDAEPPPPGCDTPNDPLKNPAKCLVDGFGVYVSPGGDDTGPGSKAKPFKTLAKALETGRQRVVMCEGTYAGGVAITRPVEIYGGVVCLFDKAGGKAKLEGVNGKEATIGIEKVDGVRLVELEITGPAVGAPSSIGVAVSGSQGVELVRCVVKGGVGAPGVDGKLVPFAGLDVRATAGESAVGTTGGGAATQTCPGGQPAGGNGGLGGGGAGQSGGPGGPSGTGGAGGTLTECVDSNTGGRPGPATPARTPAPGATALGKLASGAWTPGVGADGQAGEPGKGGGGGAGTGGGGGGGGGAGGCGGAGGGGGRGGGASFALMSVGSTVRLVATELTSGKGGSGGRGSVGQVGQGGGFGGDRVPTGCVGGNGAAGANGAPGGGGAGGVSAAVAYSGTKPTPDATTKLTTDAANVGAGGVGGAPGVNDGVVGQAKAELELPQ